MVDSRAKGCRGEREFAKLCNYEGYTVRRGQQYNGIEGQDCVGLPGIHIEVKRVERLNLYDAMDQVINDARNSDNIPIVAHKRNNRYWVITMEAEDWFKLYREWEAGRGVQGE